MLIIFIILKIIVLIFCLKSFKNFNVEYYVYAFLIFLILNQKRKLFLEIKALVLFLLTEMF